MTRILVIDDDAGTRASLERALHAGGHEVVLAADGGEGLKEHRAKRADVVITDLYMPDKDGFETIRELQSVVPKVPIIAISGGGLGETMLSMANALGAVDVLQKPFLPEDLLAAVGRALAADTGRA